MIYKKIFFFYLIIFSLNNFGSNIIQNIFNYGKSKISNIINFNYENIIIEKIKDDVNNLNIIGEKNFFDNDSRINYNLIPYHILKNYSYDSENYKIFNQKIMDALFNIDSDNIFAYIINKSEPSIINLFFNNEYLPKDYIDELNLYKNLYTNLRPEQHIKFNQKLEKGKWYVRWHNFKKYSKLLITISSVIFIINLSFSLIPSCFNKLIHLYSKYKNKIFNKISIKK